MNRRSQDVLVKKALGVLGKGVATVARELGREVTLEIEKRVEEIAAPFEALSFALPGCCDGDVVRTKDGESTVFVHAHDCRRGR